MCKNNNLYSCQVKYPTFEDFMPNGVYYNEKLDLTLYNLPKLMIRNVFRSLFLKYFCEEPYCIAKANMYNDIKRLKNGYYKTYTV